MHFTRYNPFAINLQIPRGEGTTENNPIVVPSAPNAVRRIARNNREAAATAQAPQSTNRGDSRSGGGRTRGGQNVRQNSATSVNQPVVTAQGQNIRQQVYGQDGVAQYYPPRQVQNRQQQSGPQQQPRPRTGSTNQRRGQQDPRHVSQYGNPAIWIE